MIERFMHQQLRDSYRSAIDEIPDARALQHSNAEEEAPVFCAVIIFSGSIISASF
jgi:hypothetical protein